MFWLIISDAAFTKLFDKKTGIVKFVASALKQDGFSDATRESFVLLKKLISDFKDRVSPYILEIKVWNLSTVNYLLI